MSEKRAPLQSTAEQADPTIQQIEEMAREWEDGREEFKRENQRAGFRFGFKISVAMAVVTAVVLIGLNGVVPLLKVF